MTGKSLLATAMVAVIVLVGSVTASVIGVKSRATLRTHDHQVTEKSELDIYPPEMKGFSSEMMRTREFKNRFAVTKDKKSQGFNNPGEFFKLQREIRTRGNEASPSYPADYKMIELQKARLGARGGDRLEWTERGPGNVSGRTRAIVIDPADSENNTWLAGSVAGGIWKTTDAGQSWEHKTPDLPNLSIATMVMAPSNPDVLYAGTGEGFYNIDAVRGDGILKSIDRGETWLQLGNTVQFLAINRLVVDPNDENIVLAAVQANMHDMDYSSFSSIYKTIDGGDSWYMVYHEPNQNRIQHIISNPDSFDIQYASINAVGVIKSTDAGETWTQTLDVSATGGGRLELAVAPSDPDIVYATLDRTGVYSKLYRSTDAGETWTDLAAEGAQFDNWLGSQGWYDNTIAVNPYDPEEVYVGGINLWKKFNLTQGILDVQENGTESFLAFFSWGGYEGGGVGTGYQFAQALEAPSPFGLVQDDYVSTEVRFGPGFSQYAHRFFWDGNNESPPLYQDYVEVPFEVWDTENNQQLTASFFDHDGDGSFELVEPENPANPPMIFFFVNSVPYDAEAPNSTIVSEVIGFFYKNTYVIWPLLASGATWAPDNLPESNLAIIYGDIGESIPSFQQISFGYYPFTDTGTHVDHHNITIIPVDEETETFRIVNGNDGGVFYSDDGGATWLNTLNGYNTTQFYGVDKKPGSDEYIGGMQDNGTWQSPPRENASADSDYLFRIGGDGYEASWHYEQPNKIIGGSQFNGIRRSIDGGETWLDVRSQIDNGGGNAPFVTKIGKTNSDPDLIFAVGISGVWRSDNFGELWTLAAIPNDQVEMTNMAQVRVSSINPQIVWTGSRMNDPGLSDATLHVSTDGGLTFSPTGSYTETPMGYISGLALHPGESQTAYVLFSFADAPKVLRTTDLGQTWEDISGFGVNPDSDNGFPDVATYCLLVMPHDPEVIWVGTEIGLFESTDEGVSWHYADNGLPAVSVWQMNITDDEVVLATHGLGIWTVTIPELPPPPVVTRAPRLNRLAQGPDGLLKMDIDLRSPYDSTQVWTNGELFTTLPANEDTASLVMDYSVTEPTTIEAELVAFEGGATYRSASLETDVVPYAEARNSYSSNFNEGSSDFYGSGFEITTPGGFTNAAIHSLHPYPDGADLTYLLQVPIIVSQTDSFIRFDEVVIVEPGDPGTEFGDPSFWDYVIVEGTADGIDWQPLLDGYDARSDPEWMNAYNNGQSGSAALYRPRAIDLHQTFTAGETILIRFRLYSDSYVRSWGWAIDNLEIQEELGSENRTAMKPSTLRLSQNHPNPFRHSTTIAFSIPEPGDVTLRVYDMAGRQVAALVEAPLEAGNYRQIEL